MEKDCKVECQILDTLNFLYKSEITLLEERLEEEKKNVEAERKKTAEMRILYLTE